MPGLLKVIERVPSPLLKIFPELPTIIFGEVINGLHSQ